ncbi:hypothetical protein BHM03_00009243 [Ensete ventricosum]|nr:hypothetical protein BHM03_00009243 [Ensete ventricosum]
MERCFLYHRTQEASTVDIAIIHLGREAAQWYDSYKHTHGIPTWRQFKSKLLLRFESYKHENIDGQLAKLHQTSTVQEYQTRDKIFLKCYIPLNPSWLLMRHSQISSDFHDFPQDRTMMLKVFPDDDLQSTTQDRKKIESLQ